MHELRLATFGVSQGLPYTLIPNCMGFCHGHILIETETYSFRYGFLDMALKGLSPLKLQGQAYSNPMQQPC